MRDAASRARAVSMIAARTDGTVTTESVMPALVRYTSSCPLAARVYCQSRPASD